MKSDEKSGLLLDALRSQVIDVLDTPVCGRESSAPHGARLRQLRMASLRQASRDGSQVKPTATHAIALEKTTQTLKARISTGDGAIPRYWTHLAAKLPG